MAFMRSPVRSRSGPPYSIVSGSTGVTVGGRELSERVTGPTQGRGTSDENRSPLRKKIGERLANLTKLLRLKINVINGGDVVHHEHHITGRKFIEIALPCRLRARDQIVSILRSTRIVEVGNLTAPRALPPQETDIVDGLVSREGSIARQSTRDS